MFVESINTFSQSTNVYEILKDYRKLRKAFGASDTPTCSEKIEETWNRTKSEDECKKKDRVCAKSLAAIALMNGPNDIDDIVSAWRQIKSRFQEKCPDGYDPKKAQHPFSFFRGTLFHEYLNPNSEKCINKNLAKWIIKNDVSLAETKFGEWFLKKMKVKRKGYTKSNIETFWHTKACPNYVKSISYYSPTKFGDITARALTRTPVYAVGALGSIAAIHAGYEIKEGEDVKKELAKATLEVTTTLAGVAYLGAIGYKHFATCGSLVGMGLGSIIGNLSSELIS